VLLAVSEEVKIRLPFFVQCIIKQLLDSFLCDIQNNQGLGKGMTNRKCCSFKKAPFQALILYVPDVTALQNTVKFMGSAKYETLHCVRE